MPNTEQNMSKNTLYNNEGFTLLELIMVIAILSILGAVAFPKIIEYVEMTNERVCHFNCLEVGKTYSVYLEMENIQHSETIFTRFLEDNKKICPKVGEIRFEDGIIKCGIHSDLEGEGNDEEVPYL